MTYTIHEVSQMTGIPSSTLRYYDKEGLLPFLGRRDSGYRVFHEGDLAMLQIINCLKDTGMSIKEMQQFAKWVQEGDASLEQRYDMFRQRRDAVEQQMKELQKTLDILEHKCRYYEAAIAAGTEKELIQTDVLPHSDEFLCQKY